MNMRFGITIASDVDYERLIAEIYFDDRFLALISQENEDKLEIEFPGRPPIGRIPLADFLEVVAEAKKQLIHT